MWLFLALLALLALMIAGSVFHGRRRVKALQTTAQATGWGFVPGDAPGFTADFEPAYGLFQLGRSRMASDVLERSEGSRRIEVFGYRYVVGSYKHPRLHPQTVVHIEDPRMRLPWFSLRPADAVRQMFGAQGFGNVYLHAAPQFSDQNYIAGQDPDATARRFTPAVMGAFGTLQRLAADGGGEHLFLFRSDRVEKVADLQSFVAKATAVADAFVAGAGTPPPPLA